MKFEKELFAKSASGAIISWKVETFPKEDSTIDLKFSYGQVGGAITISTETISEGLAGRTISEQAMLKAQSKINKKLDSGYVESYQEASEKKRVNILGLKKPMLACKFDSIEKKLFIDTDYYYVQRKYDGHRCIIKNVDGTLIAYTRNGKLIESIDHILSELNIPVGETVDGELYHHGTPLQTISSWIKKNQPESKQLVYIVYDVMQNEPYEQRLNWLYENISKNGESVQIAPTYSTPYKEDIIRSRDEFITQGYEGAMLRHPKSKYEDGKRSDGLIKVKKFNDDDFLVVDIISSKDGWAILSCITKEGKNFTVSAPGTLYQKYEVLEKKQSYIGKYVTVEYSGWTKDKVPFHPVATAFREKF